MGSGVGLSEYNNFHNLGLKSPSEGVLGICGVLDGSRVSVSRSQI